MSRFIFFLALAVFDFGASAFLMNSRSTAFVSSKFHGTGQRLFESRDVFDGDDTVSSFLNNDNNNEDDSLTQPGKLEELKQREAELASLLASVRREKLTAIHSRPLKIGVVGFGRFGQFISRTFAKYGSVVATSRTDYTEIANNMGVTYVPMGDPDAFVKDHDLDVIVFAVSILSFQDTVETFAPAIEADLQRRRLAAGEGAHVAGPLIVDVCSVKEHARSVMIDLLPSECDILCTHPMFGPDSGKNGWKDLNFVYEKTRIDGVLLDPTRQKCDDAETFVEEGGRVHSVHEDSEAHVEGMDRMERFLSIWEEEGCRMVPLSCSEHDEYAANSQFITHLVGRVLGSQGLSATPIDTSGFQSVMKLIGSTTADSFDLFYGLYKYNKNSLETMRKLQLAVRDVVNKLEQRSGTKIDSEKPIAPSQRRLVRASRVGSSLSWINKLAEHYGDEQMFETSETLPETEAETEVKSRQGL